MHDSASFIQHGNCNLTEIGLINKFTKYAIYRFI